MGRLQKGFNDATTKIVNDYLNDPGVKLVNNTIDNVVTDVKDVFQIANNAIVFTLSTAWMGISLFKPATTKPSLLERQAEIAYEIQKIKDRLIYGDPEAKSPRIDRFDTTKMYGVKLGDYYLPVSQTYTLQASKRTNVSSLVDGIDIIQQVRKEAKTIDCSVKISLNEKQTNLQLMDANKEVTYLNQLLFDLYDTDTVFFIDNEMLNNTFQMQYVFMSKYRFIPKVGSRLYTFEFSLMEVKYGENVLTFDDTQIQTTANTRGDGR
jgi:hypothetical protein